MSPSHQPVIKPAAPTRSSPQSDSPQPSADVAGLLPLLQHLPAVPPPISPGQAHTLQRLVGNRAVTGLLAGRTAITPPAPIRRRTTDDGFEAGSDFESDLAQSRADGTPLPAAVRANFEPRFGADFGHVRIHTGHQAGQLNRQIQAQAFTHGGDIYFGDGAYAPETAAGQRLMAHELTHTIQQSSSPMVQRALSPSQKDALKRKLGQNKYNKIEQANKLDYFATLSDGELDNYRQMNNKLFDQQLPALGTSGQTTPTSQGGLLSKLGNMAQSLFGKLWAGVTSLANSITFKIESDDLVGKLIKSLVGKFKLEMTTESIQMGISEIKQPIGLLAELEFGLEGKAQIKEDQGETLLSKLQEGASLDGLGENVLRGLAVKAMEWSETQYPQQTAKAKGKVSGGVKQVSDKTRQMFSKAASMTPQQAKEVLREVYQKSDTSISIVKFAQNLAQGGGLKFFQSQGNKLAVEGQGTARLKIGLDWLKDLVSNLIGGPLRDIEAFAKDYLLGSDTAQGQEGWGSWTWGKAKGLASALGSGIDYATGGLAGKMTESISGGLAWIGEHVLPQPVLDVLSVLGKVSKEGLSKWLEERLEFIKKLNPNEQLPTLGLTLKGEGKYKGLGQVEDMKGDVGIDLSAPQSYIGTWIDELTNTLAETAQGWKKTVAEIFQTVWSGLSGRLKLFGFEGFSFSWQKGLKGLVPSFEAGPAIRWLFNLVSAIYQAIKKGVKWIFS